MSMQVRPEILVCIVLTKHLTFSTFLTHINIFYYQSRLKTVKLYCSLWT